MLLFGVVSYKVRPPRLVSYACLYTTILDHGVKCLLGSAISTDKSEFVAKLRFFSVPTFIDKILLFVTDISVNVLGTQYHKESS